MSEENGETQHLLETPSSSSSTEKASHANGANKFEIAFNVVGIICFPLGIPYAMGQCGWWIGGIFMVYSAVSTYVNALMMGELCASFSELDSYPAIADKAYGPFAATIVSVMQWVGFWLVVVYNLVMLGEYCSILNIFPGSCQTAYMLYSFFILAILAQIPTWKDLAWLAFIFTAITVFGLVTLVIEAEEEIGSDDVNYSDITFSSAVNGMTAMAFAYGGSGMFPEMIQEMEDPREFNGPTGSLSLAYMFISPAYILAAVIGFWAWGNDCAGNIIENFPANGLRTTLLAFNLFLYMFGSLEANKLLAGKVERIIDVHPTAWLSPPSIGGLPPGVVRGFVRLLLLSTQLFFAEMLFSAGVGDIQSLTGAIAGVFLSYVLPVIFYVKIYSTHEHENDKPLLMGSKYWLLTGSAAVGILISVAGVVVAIISIVEAVDGYELFGGSCKVSLDD